MALITRKVSDLSGKEGTDDEFVQVFVRTHPKYPEPKALDVLVEELALFKSLNDLVQLEVRYPDTTVRNLAVRLADFNKAAENMDEVMQNARGTKGRVPGSRNGA